MNSEEIKEKLEDENIMAPKTSYRTKTPQKQKNNHARKHRPRLKFPMTSLSFRVHFFHPN